MRIIRDYQFVDPSDRGATAVIGNFDGEQLPGHGTIYMGQQLTFLAPVRPGDVVRAEVTVMDIDHAKRRVTLKTECLVDGKPVLKGEAKVLAPSAKLD